MKSPKTKKILFYTFISLIFFILCLWLFKPYPKPKFILTLKNQHILGRLDINIPKNARIYAVGTLKDGILIYKNPTKEWPLASLTKLMTAYVMLKHHPLKEGQNGPKIPITNEEVKEYIKFKNDGDSVAKVFKKESLSERKLLEGMLIPSANNYAYILAKWDAGNVENFVKDMNKNAKELGLKHTHYTGPAGAKASNISDAFDQYRLAQRLMSIKTFKHIVEMPQIHIPKKGIVYNVNYDLGHDGIEGIKTGTSSRALGDFIFYAKRHNVNILGVLLGVYGKRPLMDALKDAKLITNGISQDLFKVDLIKKGEIIGYAKSLKNKKTNLIALKSLSLTEYPTMDISYSLDIEKHIKLPIKVDQQIGYLIVKYAEHIQKIPISITKTIKAPSLEDRIANIYHLLNV